MSEDELQGLIYEYLLATLPINNGVFASFATLFPIENPRFIFIGAIFEEEIFWGTFIKLDNLKEFSGAVGKCVEDYEVKEDMNMSVSRLFANSGMSEFAQGDK